MIKLLNQLPYVELNCNNFPISGDSESKLINTVPVCKFIMYLQRNWHTRSIFVRTTYCTYGEHC